MSEPLPQSEEALEALVAEVVDDFRQRRQRGECPCVEEYAARHPHAAADIRRVLAALDLLELPGACAAAADNPAGSGIGPGTPLGDFRIVREIGRGGMAVVYEAVQISLGRRVALKVLPLAATMDPRRLQRFRNEARAAASLEHPSIVPVYGVGCERGVHFYAMKLINGQSLGALLEGLRRPAAPTATATPTRPGDSTTDEQAAGGSAAPTVECRAQPTEVAPLGAADLRRVAEWGVQAALALEYAHQVGVVHRDVKPANLLLDARGQLWVADFGLAQLGAGEGGLTETGLLVGTLRYMSPEQTLGKRVPIDHRTDVYSLGVTLYELLTLRLPFTGQDRQELLRQIACDEPAAPRKLRRGVPAELQTIVLKALEKAPQDRYATAQELADDLKRWLEDRPIHARRPSLGRVALKWARRHRALVGAAAAVLLLAGLLAGGNGLWWLQRRATAQGVARAELSEARRHLEREQWNEGLAAVQRAEAALDGMWADARLRQQAEALVQVQATFFLVAGFMGGSVCWRCSSCLQP
jgi:serine/threonine protein kinase